MIWYLEAEGLIKGSVLIGKTDEKITKFITANVTALKKNIRQPNPCIPVGASCLHSFL